MRSSICGVDEVHCLYYEPREEEIILYFTNDNALFMIGILPYFFFFVGCAPKAP